jgi:hypothetical protein
MKHIFLFFFSILILNLYSQVEENEEKKEVQIDSLNAPGAKLPIFSTTAGDLGADMGSQDVSGLLQSSRDVFTAAAGFNFGNARFRMRGLGSENSVVLINGIRVNDLENGWASWSNWGGLNDVTRWMQVQANVTASDKTFGGIGGYSNMDVRASQARKGNRVSYAFSNRSYNHRVMATAATGLMKNGLAVTVSASRRYANEGYVEGTFFDAWSYFVAVEKKINAKHSIGIIGFGAPMRQGRQALAVQEAYDLKGSNFYNPNWGYQNGEKRNARTSETHKPMFMATHYWNINPSSKLESSLFFSKGKSNLTGLNWYQAKDPRPDYYRYLPSYYTMTDPNFASDIEDSWANGSAGQIDWDGLYNANRKNLFTIQNEGGVEGNNVTGNRSKYIVENQIAESTISGANLVYNKTFNPRLNLSAGTNITLHNNHFYKTINDLLGGDFWVDVDNFAERDFNDPNISQNNVENPNKAIKKGDVYGYDYELNINRTETFGQLEYKLPKFESYASLMLSTVSFNRVGNMTNGRFIDDSKGKSATSNFFNYGVKTGLLYKLTGRHFVSTNFAYLTRAPLPRESFLSPRTRNALVPNLKNEEILSFDVNYNVRYAKLKARISAYYNEIKNITVLNSFYHDDYLTLVNYVMTGVNQKRQGFELGAEYNITNTISATGVVAIGDYRYSSRPNATITRDNSAEVLAENRTVYLNNYRIGGMPQNAYSLGLKYSSPKYWFIGTNFNYFANIFLEPNPDRRTADAVANLIETDPQWRQTLEQTKFDNQYTLDVYAGKSWKIKKYFLNWNVSVNNVLNNRKFVTGGFEQMRYDVMNIDKFPPKLGYHFGLTYYTMLSLRF